MFSISRIVSPLRTSIVCSLCIFVVVYPLCLHRLQLCLTSNTKKKIEGLGVVIRRKLLGDLLSLSPDFPPPFITVNRIDLRCHAITCHRRHILPASSPAFRRCAVQCNTRTRSLAMLQIWRGVLQQQHLDLLHQKARVSFSGGAAWFRHTGV